MIRITIARVSRDDKDLAMHRRGQVRASAIIPDEQLATLKYGGHLPQTRTTDDECRLAQKDIELQCVAEFGTRADDDSLVVVLGCPSIDQLCVPRQRPPSPGTASANPDGNQPCTFRNMGQERGRFLTVAVCNLYLRFVA
jgi:hypothetical protein